MGNYTGGFMWHAECGPYTFWSRKFWTLQHKLCEFFDLPPKCITLTGNGVALMEGGAPIHIQVVWVREVV
jgi:hypothetical protein